MSKAAEEYEWLCEQTPPDFYERVAMWTPAEQALSDALGAAWHALNQEEQEFYLTHKYADVKGVTRER